MHVELHRHSRWSLLDGAGDGELWAKRAAEIGMPALTLTDHGNLTGSLEHVAACQEHGVLPLLGVECYYRDNRLIHDKDNAKNYHLTLLALNYRGWLSLIRLTSEAFKSGFYGKPCVDPDLLACNSEGVYCLGGCIGGRLASHIIGGYEPDAVAFVNVLRSIYGDNFSLEIMCHDFDGQRHLNVDTWRLAYDTSTPMTATGDPHYPIKDWAPTHDVRIMLATKQTNTKRSAKVEAGEDVYTMHQDNPTLYLMSGEEKLAAFATYHPLMDQVVVHAAIEHSGEILKLVDPFLMDRSIKMPKLSRRIISQIDELSEADIQRLGGMGATEEWWQEQDMVLVKMTLREWVDDGLAELKRIYPSEHWQRFPERLYIDQIKHEFAVFDEIGDHVWRYMVMAAGECRWARREKIVFAPRGSAVASLVLYLCGISDMDPVSYDLMFERFINPGRRGMPDIDIDFMPGPLGRAKVKGHTGQIYGEDNVVDIAAYGTYGPKSAIRGVCRVFDDVIDYQTADRYAKVLDVLKPVDNLDLAQCAERFKEIAEFRDHYPVLWDHAIRIEDHPYSYSRHASGVLVKPPGYELPVATRTDKSTGERVTVTAWPDTKEQVANLGLLKLDYLVIDGLERQFEVIRSLRDRDGVEVDLDMLPARWDPYGVDPEVMAKFGRCETLGVWQLDGKGTAPVLKAVQPENMHDLAAVNALIRPAARDAGITDDYAKRKHGEVPVTFWHDSVEPVLRVTYGLMIYQEQAMEVAVQVAGFTRAEADDLRKAMGKKYREGMPAVVKFLRELGYEEKFIDQAEPNVGRKVAEKIWSNTLSYGGYGFNAPHAYRYALTAYRDMYLKHIAPSDFYAQLLTHTDSKELPRRLSATMREGRHAGVVIRPPDINRSGIGFTAIDRQTISYGLEGIKNVGAVGVKAIFEHRPYHSYAEFDARVPRRSVNKNGRQALVGAGAFDEFGLRTLLSDNEKASAEEAYVGMRISGQRLIDEHEGVVEDIVHTEDEFDEAQDGDYLCVGGEVIDFTPSVDRKGGNMARLTLAFGGDTYRVTCFASVWPQWAPSISMGAVVFFEGTKQVHEIYGTSFVAKQFMTLQDVLRQRQQQKAVA